MKKNKLNNKLSLSKNTISKLNPIEMNNVQGGEELGRFESTYSMCLKTATWACNTNWTCDQKGPVAG